MRWPWSSKGVEVRDGYTDTVLRILQGRADGGLLTRSVPPLWKSLRAG